MILLILNVVVFWGLTQAVQRRRLPYYGAALIFIAINLLLDWIFSSAYIGHSAALPLRNVPLQLLIALGAFYAIDRLRSRDAPILPAFILVIACLLVQLTA